MHNSKNVKCSLFGLTAIALAFGLTACGTGNDNPEGSADETITLRFAHYLPTEHVTTTAGFDVWMEEVEQRTDGQVEFEYYPGGQLMEADQIVPSLQSGAIDIGGFLPPTVASSELPLSEIAQVPGFLASDARVLDEAYQELLTSEGPVNDQWEEAGLVPFMSFLNGSYEFSIVGEPVENVEGWQGYTMRTPGGVAESMAEQLGGSAVNLPASDQYESMERGVVDSSINTIESLPAYDLDQVIDSLTANAPLGGPAAALAINQDVYEGLPENVQDAIFEAADVARASHHDRLVEIRTEIIDSIEDDVEVYELSDDSLEELAGVLEATQDLWIERYENGQETADAWVEAIERAENTHD